MARSAVNVGLGAVLALLVVSGSVELVANSSAFGWLYVLHRGAALALAPLLVWKAPFAWRSLRRRRAALSVAPGLALLVLTFGLAISGTVWIGGWGRDWSLAGNSILALHLYLYYVLPLPFLLHVLVRWEQIRLRTFRQRRTLLRLGLAGALGFAGVSAFGLAAVALRRKPAARRFTGSFVAGTGLGNDFPVTAFIADDPAPVDAAAWRLRVFGKVRTPLALTYAEVSIPQDAVVATVDCTGGWAAQRLWSGQSVGAILQRAGPRAHATAVRFHSLTGYWTLLPIAEARAALAATHVGAEPLAHGHGFPARLVAPERRGFQWVKWLDGIEVI